MKASFAIRLVVGATVLGIAAGGCLGARAQSPDSEKIAQLFKNINHHVIEAEYDAELLETYTRSKISWKTHADRVNEMKAHINDLGRDFTESKNLRAEGSEWQKEAIDQIEPLLQSLASHLSTTIDHLNQNQSRIDLQPWTDYVRTNRDYVNKASNLIRDYVDYGEARARADALESKLELSRTPGQE